MQALTIYKSSAGSGKTFTLVKEYLKLVLVEPKLYRNVLAITFTNKAAAEMKSRILESLSGLAEGKEQAMADSLIAETNGVLTDALIKNRSAETLSLILHDYSGFAVSTIDSFFYKIIRAIAREMQLPLSVEIELDIDRVLSMVTDKLYESMDNNPILADWMETMVSNRMSEGKGWKIDTQIVAVARELLNERLATRDQNYDAKAIKTFSEELWKIRKDYEEKVKVLGERGMKILDMYNLDFTDFPFGLNGFGTIFPKAIKNPGTFDIGTRMQVAAQDDSRWYKANDPRQTEIEACRPELLPIVKELVYLRQEGAVYYNTACLVLHNIYLFGIAEDLLKNLKNYREEQGVLLISDISILLHNLIKTSDTPFVYEKAGSIYKHFLLDEFQDTSNVQWKDLHPLVSHSMSSGNFNLIVGDAKQAIYRWRNGEVELLLNGVKDSLPQYSSMIDYKALKTNFRSKKEIVEFNNLFFEKALEQVIAQLERDEITDLDLLKEAYRGEDAKQIVSDQHKEGGYVKISFLENTKPEKKKKKGQETVEALQDEEDEPKKKWKELACEGVFSTIETLKKEGFSYGDMAILVRSNKEGATITNYLIDNNITNVISPDSLMLESSPEVRFLISVLSFMHNPDDSISKANIHFHYYTIIAPQPETDLHALFSHFNKKSDSKQSAPLPGPIMKQLVMMRKLPLYELTEQLLQIFNLHQKPNAFIQRFQDIIYDFIQKANSGIQGFLQWWDEYRESEKCSLLLPENQDSITVMTIHKSKGLQFPIVFMPFMEWKMKPEANKPKTLWVSTNEEPFKPYCPLPVPLNEAMAKTYFSAEYKQEITQYYLDNLNLLYVALTRPEQRFYGFCPTMDSEKINSIGALLPAVLKAGWAWQEFDTFELGATAPPVQKKKNKTTPISLSRILSGPWNERISIATKGKGKMDAFTLDESDRSVLDLGLLIHGLLQEIDTVDDIDSALQRLEFEGMVEPAEKDTLRALLDYLTQHRDTSFLFEKGWDVKNENDILLPDGTVLRPDRVMFRQGQAIVVDYKTGLPHESHAKQVQEYAHVLSQMGVLDIQKYILYLRTNPADTFIQQLP